MVFSAIFGLFLEYFVENCEHVTDRAVHIFCFFCNVILKKKANPVTEKVAFFLLIAYLSDMEIMLRTSLYIVVCGLWKGYNKYIKKNM